MSISSKEQTINKRVSGEALLSTAERVTWLLPVKDAMPYLPETLASIESQTYGDWEILAWDNGSSDGSLEELHRWIPSRLPGRIVSDPPLPLAVCLAQMVQACQTDLCARVDADDVCAPHRLACQVAYLREHPEIDVVGSWTDRLDASSENHGLFHHLPTSHEDIVSFMLQNNPLAHPTVLMRRAAVLAAGNYQDVGPAEDYELWLRMAAAGHRLANIDQILLHYRVHAKSATQLQLTDQTLSCSIDNHIGRHAKPLYGCSAEDLQLLRQRRHPRAIRLLRQIARHRATGLMAQSLIEAGQALVCPMDTVSRIALAAVHRNPLALPRELARIAKSGVLNALGTIAERWQEAGLRRQFENWRLQQEWTGSRIHRTLEMAAQPAQLDLVQIGAQCSVERDVTIWLSSDTGADPRLTVASNVFIGRNSYIGVYQPIHIGKDVRIGAYSYIISANHDYKRRDIPICLQGFSGAPIVIEDDVWLGAHVIVLPGITIGKGAIVGAGSVVTKNVPSHEIWAGSPARFIRQRP